jgi:hypothetical protein
MFSQTDGPTALRQDLVRALSLSVGTACIAEGEAQCACAALSGVWNGRKGYVVLLVRWTDAPLLRRYAYSEPLTSLQSLHEVVDEGVGFAQSLGFVMDLADWTELAPELQKQRLHAWNELRKLDRVPSLVRESAARPAAPSRQVLARIPVVSRPRDPGASAGPEARLRAQF